MDWMYENGEDVNESDYNKAVKYLQEKYDTKVLHHADIKDITDQQIRLCLNQYYLGMEAKKELNKLMRLIDAKSKNKNSAK